MATISKEERASKSSEFDSLKKQYENYDFLDLEQRELLAAAEMYDFSELFQ